MIEQKRFYELIDKHLDISHRYGLEFSERFDIEIVSDELFGEVGYDYFCSECDGLFYFHNLEKRDIPECPYEMINNGEECTISMDFSKKKKGVWVVNIDEETLIKRCNEFNLEYKKVLQEIKLEKIEKDF